MFNNVFDSKKSILFAVGGLTREVLGRGEVAIDLFVPGMGKISRIYAPLTPDIPNSTNLYWPAFCLTFSGEKIDFVEVNKLMT